MVPIALSPNHANNDWYEELCALAAIGELSSAEFAELQQHLAECGNCRELYADFQRISSDDLGLVAIQKRTDEPKEDVGGALDEQLLLTRFLERAQRERETMSNGGNSQPAEAKLRTSGAPAAWIMQCLRRPALAYGAVVLLLAAAVGVGAYRLRDTQLSPLLAQLHAQLSNWKSQAEAAAAQQKSASQLLQQSQSEREALQNSLAVAQTKYTELQAEQKALQTELATATARLEQLTHDLQAARTGAEQKDKLLEDLQAKLQDATLRLQEQEAVMASLGRKLQRAEQEASASANPPVEDAEAKELFGARELHIVDVYDVDSTGKTRRTFGRVYYVEKKLLVFYAFDLQDKRHNRIAAGFQAWGYRQANAGKPEDLGLFYVDDASLNRWVLKVNNPRVLERIDAVFVTLEPPGGSPSPRGRKLLYANLGGPPNHP